MRWFFLLFAVTAYSAETVFLKPLLERLQSDKLAQQLAQWDHSGSPSRSFERALTAFFLSEALEWEGRPHEASSHWSEVEHFCTRELPLTEIPNGLPDSLCALFETHQSLNGSGWNRYESARSAIRYLERARAKGKVSNIDRHYVEGRVFLDLPAGLGRDTKQAIFQFQVLDRLFPQTASVKIFLGMAYLQSGLREVGEKFLAEGRSLDPHNPRFAPWQGNLKFISAPRSGLQGGIYPSFFASSSNSLGGRLSLEDPRLFDTDRELALSLWATLSGQFGAEAEVRDVATLDNAALFLKAGCSFGEESFFGIGPFSLLSDQTVLDTEREFLELAAGNFFLNDFYLKVGWVLHWYQVRKKVTGPLSPLIPYSFDSGAFAELGMQSKQAVVRLRGDFPQENFLSTEGFARWLAEAGIFGGLGGRWFGRVHATAISLSNTAPFGSYARLTGEVSVPGIRYNRFVDRGLVIVWSEISRPLVSALTLGVFGSAGNVASDIGGIFQSRLLAGAGVSGWWGSLDKGIRGEWGMFANEFSFSIRAHTGL